MAPIESTSENEKWGRLDVSPLPVPPNAASTATTQTARKRRSPGTQVHAAANEAAAVPILRYSWLPPRCLNPFLPNPFEWTLVALVIDGMRLFFPVLPADLHLVLSATAGVALRQYQGFPDVSHDRHGSLRAQLILYRRLMNSQSRHKNSFSSARSLVRQCSDSGQWEKSLLPVDLGQFDNSHPGWSIPRLIKEGREAARKKGIDRPTMEDRINYGIAAAARLNPLMDLSTDQIQGLIRRSLFDLIADVSPLLTAENFENRLLDKLFHDCEDQKNKIARKWIEPGNNLAYEIAKLSKKPGGKTRTEEITKWLQDAGWKAAFTVSTYAAQTLCLFRRLLPQPLTEQENRYFEMMHLPQDCFGGLSYYFLADRHPLINTMFDELVEGTGTTEAARLHRMLSSYAEIAEARRETDRHIKHVMQLKKGIRNGEGFPRAAVRECPRADQLRTENQLQAIAEIAHPEPLACGCEKSSLRLEVISAERNEVHLFCEIHPNKGKTLYLDIEGVKSRLNFVRSSHEG